MTWTPHRAAQAASALAKVEGIASDNSKALIELLEHPWVKPSADKCRVEIEQRLQAAPPADAKPKKESAVVGLRSTNTAGCTPKACCQP